MPGSCPDGRHESVTLIRALDTEGNHIDAGGNLIHGLEKRRGQ